MGDLLTNSGTAAYLSVEDVEKSYLTGDRRQSVLRGLSLSVRRRERVALLGQSGSGKSTLLNVIAGIDSPDAGGIFVDGVEVSALPETKRTLFRRRQIGFIYQSFNLISSLSAIENISLPLQLNGLAAEQVRDMSQVMLARVGLQQRGHAFPDQLSGGEQQRVAIARAMVHRPALVLADEHTGNLDAQTGASMMELFNEIAEETAQTVVMVTHSDAVASTAHRIVTIEDGLVQQGCAHSNGTTAW